MKNTKKTSRKSDLKKVPKRSTSTKTAPIRKTSDVTDRHLGAVNYEPSGWVRKLLPAGARELKQKNSVLVFFVTEAQPKKALNSIKKLVGAGLPRFQEASVLQWLERRAADALTIPMASGPLVLVAFPEVKSGGHSPDPLEKSTYARARDAAGAAYTAYKSGEADKIVIDFGGSSRDEISGFLTGLEIASYGFAETMGYKAPGKKKPALFARSSAESTRDVLKVLAADASRLGAAVNLARHLTNLPGGTLTPTVYAEYARELFRGQDHVRVDVWDESRLRAEGCGLHLAVGSAAEEPPRLVHISYRPSERGAERRPVALVGKGITFDSGGLDLKPSSGMRLMKKDMGGSAAALAIAWWAVDAGLPLALDVYLALAENAVSSRSFRPGDIVKARNGLAIEIHNTDAEGRLVLADAMDVAVSAKDEDRPACLIDLATLTGAIKVGLGADIAGLFTTSDDLGREIYDAGVKRGDLSWRMPLFQPYKSALRSPFADYVNAGDGFGGAITAALFLQLFAKDVPWAHLDIYAWKDSAAGAWLEGGGSGQGVLALSEVLGRLVSGKWAEG
ncbi:MAG: leucyl aminopeptidase family protein [Bdellovibrionaceae bacterium]|nr:leucyl aminopeptidase family protein [Pseudobdellovibrionaceae bacterium]